ncbi:hypothetical protein [Parasitella parasitica]|uniref:Cation-transporting P-type ATPase C-terminal domain-containing protein n=1 Tax=Parasitella parasitica TaxID=35722 RepID=A0A0B7N9H9_9FUNG|nr:hypothetical protein [Parasitella parasitica]
MSANKESNEIKRTSSEASHNSAVSFDSASPLNALPEPVQDEEGTTFFLLDVANESEPVDVERLEAPAKAKSKRNKLKKGADNEADNDNDDNNSVSSHSSKSSTNSSSSSVSAQVVIDHGSSIPRRFEKNGATHLLRSGDDESESDYAFCYTPIRRESDTDSVSNHQRRILNSLHAEHVSSHLHMMESSSLHSQQDTDMSAAENDGDDDLDDEDEDDRDSLSRHNTDHGTQNDHIDTDLNGGRMSHSNRTARRRRSHKHNYHRNGKHSTGLARNGNRKDQLANSKAMVTVYTEEDDDLVDEMPRRDRERMMRHNERNYRRHNHEAGCRRRSIPRRLHKRTQRVLQTNLQSQSWSRRESLQSSRHPGLSSEEALSKLLYLANSIIAEERARIDKTIVAKDSRTFLLNPAMVLSGLSGIGLLAFYIAGYFKSEPYQFRVTGLLVEALLLLSITAWNGYIFYREQVLAYREMTDRASTIIGALERSGMNMVQDTKIPFIPSMSVAKVVRDGVVRIFPVNLMVEGDVVEMLYGDIAPGRMKYIHKTMSAPNQQYDAKDDANNEVDAKQRKRQSTNSSNSKTSESSAEPPLNTKEYYIAKDQSFKPSFFGIPPPSGLMEEYMRSRGRHQFTLLESPLEKNMRRALSQKRPNTVMHNESYVIIRVFYKYIIWIVLAIALLVNFLRYGVRSTLINHFPADQLVEEVFTMSIYAIIPLLPLCIPSMWIIARSFGNAQLLILFEALQISKTEYEDDDEVDEFDAEAPPPTKDLELSPNAVWDRFLSLLTKWDRLSLTRSTNLLESLGSTTVICCLDREGTIANPFPTVEQLMFPNNEEDITYLDVEEDSDEETGLKFEDQGWERYLPCLKPLGLNFMLNTNCGVIQSRKRSEYHRRRSKLHVYGKTAPARQSCLCKLGKCIGFREEALQSFALRAEIYTFAPYHEILNTPRYKYSKYYQFEVPNALSTVFEERTSGSYQLLTDGHPSLVIDKCSDYWDGNSLQTMSETMEKKINDFFQNALVHDMQCIAYAYRPINTVNDGRIPFLNPSDDEDEDPGCAFVVLPYKPPNSDSSDSSSSSSSSDSSSESSSASSISLSGQGNGKQPSSSVAIIEPAAKTSRTTSSSSDSSDTGSSDYSFEEDDPIDEQEEATFYKEVNVVDFIEDLGLAGIRFVYFSTTAERESKAFAERLGLETDWNSCILLSNPDDENCGNGYLQTHDIKAQLPRGIDEIRPHLEDVDDIPLHVSLFAECTPRAMREMIRIFQENGEVVCCIGNALNTKNTESFALSDVSIAMEPMHTRAQSKGRLSTNDRQPPLAVGASLCSLPCGLFMQYETSLYAVTQLIRDARRLLTCVRMGFAFYVAGCMSMSLMLLLSFCLLLPPIFAGYQILWVLWIILPILSMSMLFTPHEDGIMLLMPGKNIEHLTDFWRFMVYFVLRFILVITMCIAIYAMTLIYSLGISITEAFGKFGTNGWYHWTTEEQWAVTYAQNFMLLSFVWYLACISPSFLHRTSSLLEFIPFRNRIWIGAFFLSVILQFCFCAVSLAQGPFDLSIIPWFVYFLGFAWPIVLMPVQELVKMHDNKEFTRFQKRSKLEFSTKLGMHSPL